MSMTLLLVLLTLLVTLQGFKNSIFFEKYCVWPYREKQNKEYHRMLTGGFLHGSWLHFGINMFVFWQFGTAVEKEFMTLFQPLTGQIVYTLVYLLVIVAANVPGHFRNNKQYNFRAVGASGGVAGILFIYILFNPWRNLYLYALIPIPAILMGILYLWYSSYAAKNSRDNIDHSAHFWGAIAGMVLTLIAHPPIFPKFLKALIQEFPF
jgi:membrane associated rhomboid family serine protease